MTKMNKTGQFGLNNLSTAAIGVVVFIIVVAIGLTVLSQISGIVGNIDCTRVNSGLVYNQTTNLCQFPTNSTTYGAGVASNLTVDGTTGIALFSDFTSIIVIVVIAAVILALIAVAFRAFA